MLKSRLIGMGLTAIAGVLGVYLSTVNPDMLAAICRGAI